jgi:hypothetical protein
VAILSKRGPKLHKGDYRDATMNKRGNRHHR